MFKFQLKKIISDSIQQLRLSSQLTTAALNNLKLEHPVEEDHGDYAANVALILFGQLDSDLKQRLKIKSPRDLAQKIIDNIKIQHPLKKVEVAGPGFINFYLSEQSLIDHLAQIQNQGAEYGLSEILAGQTLEIEHTSPNPNKAMHLGHLRNNVTGMSISNLWEAAGAEVIRDAVDNDRGIAIARLMWGYLKFAHKENKEITDLDYWYQHQDEWLTPKEADQRPDKFVDKLYLQASQDFKKPEVEQKVRQLVVDWEAQDKQTWALWQRVMNYSHLGQKLTLDRLGNQWDQVWHEHEHYQKGKDLVQKGLKQGIFRELEDGAILSDLKEYGLPDTILQKSDGTSLYITQDLALTQLKKQKYHADKLYWVVGPEQNLALKQLFAVCEQLDIADYDDLTHLSYGYMSIKGQGKMSSRAGNVVYIDDLIDRAKAKVQQVMDKSGLSAEEVKELSEKVALGAVKYSILKVGRTTDTAFDFNQALRLDGQSGPYLQYAHARAKSVLAKAKQELRLTPKLPKEISDLDLTKQEQSLMRYIYRYPEKARRAALNNEPSIVAQFSYDLAQRFNTFYNHCPVLTAEKNLAQFRLVLTRSVAIVLDNGLNLLGIDAPDRM